MVLPVVPRFDDEGAGMTHNEMLAEVYRWPEALRSDFEERASILEFDAGFERAEAEELAWRQLKHKAPFKKQMGLGL